ncbi:Deneddylase UL48 [Gossypium australe]|uniref:Deneddylase UL48 n=1 Tax=Gossypium australe TaxID=47621 RepID=A0A5B6UW18_9ROSI|nr:Deneddylase UL48 [Gossypium australe]
MITRSKLVDQLRGYQIRSQNKCPALILFSPKPHITSWTDALLAIHYGYMAWYFASHTFEKLSTGTGEERGEEISITFVNVKPFLEL